MLFKNELINLKCYLYGGAAPDFLQNSEYKPIINPVYTQTNKKPTALQQTGGAT